MYTDAKMKVYAKAINLIWETCCNTTMPNDLDDALDKLNYIAGVADLTREAVRDEDETAGMSV